jgi:hypothetical protein
MPNSYTVSTDCVIYDTKIIDHEYIYIYFFFNVFFWLYWDLSSGPCACQSSTLPLDPYLFALDYFSDRVWLFFFWPGWASDIDFLHIWDHRHVPPHTSLLLRWDLVNLSPGLALNHDPPNLCFYSSWDTGVSHCAQPSIVFHRKVYEGIAERFTSHTPPSLVFLPITCLFTSKFQLFSLSFSPFSHIPLKDLPSSPFCLHKISDCPRFHPTLHSWTKAYVICAAATFCSSSPLLRDLSSFQHI